MVGVECNRECILCVYSALATVLAFHGLFHLADDKKSHKEAMCLIQAHTQTLSSLDLLSNAVASSTLPFRVLALAIPYLSYRSMVSIVLLTPSI